MKRVLALIIVILCFGCKQEESKPKIEIYLLKERKQFTNCIPFRDTEYYQPQDTIDVGQVKYAQYDTILKKLIYAGDYIVSGEDLQRKPFISDIEMRQMNLKENEFIIDSLAAKRIYNMRPKNSYGNQFAITVDGKPVFAGYFWNPMSRFRCDWYQIHAYDLNKELKDNGKDKCFRIYLGKRDGQILDEDLPYPPELIEAFRSSGRLIE
jgi:hypothetical protein